MIYIVPHKVVSPKNTVSDLQVIHDDGEESWALAKMNWDGSNVFALRWNGTSENPVGNPQSRSKPTWFILPKEMITIVIEMLKNSEWVSSKKD